MASPRLDPGWHIFWISWYVIFFSCTTRVAEVTHCITPFSFCSCVWVGGSRWECRTSRTCSCVSVAGSVASISDPTASKFVLIALLLLLIVLFVTWIKSTNKEKRLFFLFEGNSWMVSSRLYGPRTRSLISIAAFLSNCSVRVCYSTSTKLQGTLWLRAASSSRGLSWLDIRLTRHPTALSQKRKNDRIFPSPSHPS